MKLPMPAQRGFTMVELLVTVSLIAILLALALPSFQSSRLNTLLRTSANNLLAGTHLAAIRPIRDLVRTSTSPAGTTPVATGAGRRRPR